jgi:hypothetical protein
MMTERLPELKGWSIDDKLALAAEIWDEAHEAQDLGADISPSLWEAMLQRIEMNNSLPGSTWEEMVARIKSRNRNV